MISRPPSSVKFTYEDFLLFPDDGKRHELIDGDHYVTPSPNLRHQTLSGRLHHAIASYLDEHPVGQVWAAPLDCVLSRFDVVEPDLIYVSNERVAILTNQNIQGAPDLAVEILSPGTRKTDEVVKRRAYERFGVEEYWVADPELDSIKIYRLRGGKFERAGELSAENGDLLTTPLLPELRVDLRKFFK